MWRVLFISFAWMCTTCKSDQGNVITIAGNPTPSQGSEGGVGTYATLTQPSFLDVDENAGVIYVTESSSHVVKSISLQGVVSTIAGSKSNSGSTNGVGSYARFRNPLGVALDGVGSAIFIADSSNNIIRRLQCYVLLI
jgi:DNA-binding beta-propeller fold protein YncE